MHDIESAQIELTNELSTDETIQEYVPENEIIPIESLKVAEVAMEQLKDIYVTISQAGVSSHDLADIKAITDRLSAKGVNLPRQYSLENYARLVTPERSSLNLEISTESILKTIGATLKKWIQWLIDATTKTIRWFKSVAKADVIAEKRIAFYNNMAMRAKSSLASMVSFNPNPSNEAIERIELLTKENLQDPALPRNIATLVAFGLPSPNHFVKQAYKALNKNSETLLKFIEDVTDTLSSDKLSPIDRSLKIQFTNTDDWIEKVYKELQGYFDVKSDKDYFYGHRDIGEKFYEHLESRIIPREYYSYRIVYDNYVKCGTALTKVSRLANSLNDDNFDVASFERLQALLKDTSDQIDMINKTVDLFNQLKSSYIKVSILYTNQFLQMAKVVQEDCKVVTDQQAANLKRASDVLGRIFKDLGL